MKGGGRTTKAEAAPRRRRDDDARRSAAADVMMIRPCWRLLPVLMLVADIWVAECCVVIVRVAPGRMVYGIGHRQSKSGGVAGRLGA